MKKLSLISVLLTISLATSAGTAPPQCLLGRWRSDAGLTLADMRKNPEVSEKARQLFENDFFGKLVLIFTAARTGSYLEPEDRSAMVFKPLDVVSATDKSVVVRSSSAAGLTEYEFNCEAGKLWVHTTRWKFREYFSRE